MPSLDSVFEMPRCKEIDIEDLPILQLQAHLEAGSFTSADLTACYLERIQKINPLIRAVIETNPDALSIAARTDSEREAGQIRSQIHGIPFLVKDNIATKDKMQTTAGCAALQGTKVLADAHVVTLLRDAGGILLGKANMSEWASMRASYYSEGYSSRGGQNRNPYNLRHHPGGSSSGSASAVASNMCAFSIGTETDGSIMFPADRNAVVGIKPAVGLTSTEGVIPEAPSLDTVGAFGRTIQDAAIVLDIIENKTSGTNKPPPKPSSYVSCITRKSALNGAKFGLPMRRVWDAASKDRAHSLQYSTLMKLMNRLREEGAHLIEVDFPSANEILSPDGWDWTYADGKSGSELSEFEVVKFEFYRKIAEYLSTLGRNQENIRSLEDVVAYNVKHKEKEGGLPHTHPAWPTGQDNFDRCIEAKFMDKAAYQKALEYIRRKSREEGIDAALMHTDGPLDGLLVPLQADGGAACSVAAKAGYPMITIPVGVDGDGVPFGIGIIQTTGGEDMLVRYGSALEDLIHLRNRPMFLNTNASNYTYIGTPPEKQQPKP